MPVPIIIDAPDVVGQIKNAINAICRNRDLTRQQKLDVLDKIQRHAERCDTQIRADIRAARRKEAQ